MSHSGGKIEVRSTVPIENPEDLATYYTPGVADQAERLAAEPSRARSETVKSNSVAVVSDGSALLGLGDQGPTAALAVMEGKAALLKRFADVDAWPVCPVSRDVDDLVRTVTDLATSFGAINLEDVAAPRCFELEARLREELDIPVFHDDQHGTAIVVLAALHNALAVTGRDLGSTSFVLSGAGAAGSAITRLLITAGADAGRIVVCDSQGALHTGRDLDGEKKWLAEHTNSDGATGAVAETLRGADVFIGVSTGGLLSEDDVAAMAEKAIVFALANPDPEVDPDAARRHAAVVATGRSDYPNQINNVLVFPGVFRGLLDAGATEVTDDVQLAAARAIADHAGGVDGEPDAGHVVPDVFDDGLVRAVAEAVEHAEAT